MLEEVDGRFLLDPLVLTCKYNGDVWCHTTTDLGMPFLCLAGKLVLVVRK